MRKTALSVVAYILLIIGGLNLGIIGVSDKNLIIIVMGAFPFLIKAIYVLIGLSAIYLIYSLFVK